jgi:hypothetical protein
MTTYWLTRYECISCNCFAETKMPRYPFPADIKKFQKELEKMQDLIISSLKSEPSNGWPGTEYENSYRIGLVKIRARTRPGRQEPSVSYELRCFLCGFRINEEVYRRLLRIGPSETANGKSEDLEQPRLDNFFDNYSIF